ncbi:MAG: HAD hydrolase-like protein [Candidatus Aenigmarchaeota archaeon]|nr:HAD hydrolase-like protein [Candidatus Aenigmarchaeota archaeon]
MKMKMFIFDIDGVIFDSIKETNTAALQAFKEIEEKDLTKDAGFLEKLTNLRPYIRNAKDYYVIIRLILEGKITDNVSVKQMNSCIEKWKSKIDLFHKKFYEVRGRMEKLDYDNWISLIRPYPGVIETIKSLKEENILSFSTAKDIKSVFILLNKFGLDFTEDHFVGNEISLDKNVHIKTLSERFGIPFKDILFIDDLFFQLMSVKDSGVKLAMPSWGYSTEDQRRKAKEMGISVLTLNNLKQQLMEVFE